jgi:hypothetical protein
MPRKPRWMQLADHAAYHVMSRGHSRETLFADADDHRHFPMLLDRQVLNLLGHHAAKLSFII